jgi:hypothetical protein
MAKIEGIINEWNALPDASKDQFDAKQALEKANAAQKAAESVAD